MEGDDNLFAVNQTNGIITLKKELDREEVDYYELKIIASNRDSLPSNYDEKSVLVVEIEVRFINFKIFINKITIVILGNRYKR